MFRFFMIKGNLNYDHWRQLQIKTASQIELQESEQVLMIFLGKKVYMLISLGPALVLSSEKYKYCVLNNDYVIARIHRIYN